MKKLKLLLCLVLVLTAALVMCSCMDANTLNSYLGALGLGTGHTCVDANGDTACDTCSAYVAPPQCTAHVDGNNDGVCDNPGCNTAVLMEMRDIVFNSRSFTYDGTPKTIEVKGAPAGANVDYSTENTQTKAGTYEITAYITADGYADCEVSATLKIKQKTLTITWGEVGPFPANGKTPEIDYTVDGVLEGERVEVNLDFGDCDFTKEGSYEVVATSKNPNYKIKTTSGANAIDFIVGPNAHTVTFITDVEGKNVDPEKVADGELVDKPSVFNLGYEFLGWYKGEELWDFNTPVTESMTLTAKWKLLNYEITYYLNGGSNNPANPNSYTTEDGLKMAAPTKEGKVFLGWYEDSAYTVPLTKTAPGERINDVTLYAKWSDDGYTQLVSGASLDASFVLDKYIAAGSFRYTFSATVASIAENGVIYIGRGRDAADGSYIAITSQTVTVYTNGENGAEESKTHIRNIKDFIVIDVLAKRNGATITVRTGTGEFSGFFFSFVGTNGEIFASAENAELKDASLAWYGEGFENPVWILADSNTSFINEKSWAKVLADESYLDVLLMSAGEAGSAEILEAFESALEISTPVYAVWSFDSESGADYDANLAAFVALCKEKGIIPVLTTQLEAVNAANAAKNEAVAASGEKYIDFAALSEYTGLYDNGYTELGAKALYAKILVDIPELLTPTALVDKAEAEVLNSENNTLVVATNKVKDGKVLVFTAKLDGELKDDQKIIIGHGYGSTYAAWTEINATQTISYSQGAKADAAPSKNAAAHGITIKNYVTIIMVQDKAEEIGYTIDIVTDGGSYSRSLRGNPCNGSLALTVEGGLELTDASFSFACLDYSAPVWIFGASYFSLGDSARWPNYMYADGFAKDILIVGRGGLNTTGGLVELKDALRHATPEYIIWGYGMNDGKDSDGMIKQVTYDNHIEFLQICKDNGIEAIFMSSVNCTDNVHDGKIDYVFNRLGRFADYDYRVISLPHAVDGYEVGSEWYDGMLSGDGIHPTQLGARNFYLETLCTFPELMLGVDATVKSAKSESLSDGSTLKVEDTPEFVDGDFAISVSADYSGYLDDGAIEIGTGKGVEGGTWVRITDSKVEVYRTVNGESVLVTEEDNEILMNEIFMLRIIVKDNKANIAFVSSGEQAYSASADRNALFSVLADWSYAGDVFVRADSVDLTDVLINFATK